MRKKLKGIVIGDKNSKTRVVEIKKVYNHPKYDKVLNKLKKLHCHDEKNISAAGDTVVITETRPMSKMKKWSVVEVVKGDAAKTSVGEKE
ncbi:MAG: 30S ribosomal protein S17 [Candidatus Omnitrophota bacterium]|nr:30S ribosomal protein S17 [Candidatus Omnitrophota bacterium]MBU2528198.1 30S ribosomal protein S17 [bacterium]MBU3929576.1 30S ribosomal protein S17 [bacterium]MBU4123321.1 30S ribosomal protein S17 [bacterium]MDO9513012.1 30S ribosomal protein S17 [Elusimicrobiota bacterium]